MPAVQTNYTGIHSPAYAGLIADMEHKNIISRVASVNPLYPALPAYQGSGDYTCAPWVANPTTRLIGITVWQNIFRPEVGNFYAVDDIVPVMTQGTVWVVVTGACVGGGAVYIDAAGNFTGTAAGGTVVPNCFWDSSAVAAGLARLRLNIG